MSLVVSRPHPQILQWTIDRPDRANGIGTTIALELREALKAVQGQVDRSEIQALILTAKPRQGKRGTTWIGGGDLQELALLEKDEGYSYASIMGEVCEGLAALPVPVIAAIDGKAIGGGAELALFCDVRLGTTLATLEFRQLRLGLSTGYGGARQLCALVGLARAQELIWLGKPLEAASARNLGLLHEVCESSEKLAQRALAIAVELATLEPSALKLQKQLLHGAFGVTQVQERSSEARKFGALWRNPTHAAILDGFTKKK